ncbi:hypothetical protein DNTS_017908 [Danionella cerebrum]|uniref:SWIM-type zinc finger 7 associated protein 1 n=1 Tax=Danionella cerebrum TaxID=2873325 RepID=A0A553MSA1_9TELE|nr:hypothetical protein DNTS_017908 [Danionella translucida]
MADFLGVLFRRFSTGTSDSALPPLIEGNTLVVGDANVTRSLLFLAAVTAATDLGIRVLFFTQSPFQSLPVSLRASLPELKLESLKNVQFVYSQCLPELMEDVASLHQLPSPPSLIIVDSLDQYLLGTRDGQDDLGPVAHTIALLHDTAAFLSQGQQAPCRLLVSWHGEKDVESTDQMLDILDRFLQVRCTLEGQTGYLGQSEHREWQVYLSFTCPAPELKGQQWNMLQHPVGTVEFRCVNIGHNETMES